jgi:hypothetical protein
MLHRANSKASNRLSRRKSTSSVLTKQDYIDREVTRQLALAAATYAYERGNAEMGRSGEVPRNDNMLDQRHVSYKNDEADQGGRGVRRQQSVRFTGPEATPTRRSVGTRALQGSLEDKAPIASLRPRTLTNNVPVPAAYRPPSRSSSIGKASIGKGTAQSIVTAPAAYDEYYTQEDDIASTPSSYHRMRESKSTRTFSSPSKAAKVPINDIITGNDYNTRIWNQVPWIPSQQYEAALRAPKSMSFLRRGSEYMTPAVREDHDNAVQMARDKFLHQIEQQRLREQPSFLFRAKTRTERPFRQPVRSGSTNSYGIPVRSANQISRPKEGSLRLKARKASQTIKKKLKELFRRGGDQIEEAKIPEQQVEARTSHGSSSYATVAKARQDEFVDIPRPDGATVLRVASWLPSLHTVSSSQQLKSRNGSVRSQRSDGSGKSRVTSWTSTVDNMATSRHAQAEREAQGLSIIQENGIHVSPASFVRLGVSNQLSAYPVFHRPRSAQRHGGSSPSPVGSQKVYLALMKRLDENPTVKLEVQHALSGENNGSAMCIPPRSTSVSSHHSSRGTRTPATVRHVQDDAADWNHEKQRHDDTVTSLPCEDDDVFSPRPPLDTGNSIKSHDNRSGPTAYPLLNTSGQVSLPLQQQAARNELLMIPLKPLRETSSTSFGNSSFTINRNTGPYRRALAEADYNPAVIIGELPTGPSPSRILFAPPVIHCSDPKEMVTTEPVRSEEAYTESVYSRTTSGRVPAAESSQSLDLFQDDLRVDNNGSVVLGVRKTYQPSGPARSGKSTSGPAGRKALMTSEATIMDKSNEASKMFSIYYALPSMPKYFGHFREHAQITDEETQVSQRQVSMNKQPIGVLQHKTLQIAQLKPILKHKSSTSLNGFPMCPPPQSPLPPPVPMRSPLRPMQSRASLRSVDDGNIHRTLRAPFSIIKPEHLNNHQLSRPISFSNINRADTPAEHIKQIGRPSNNYNLSPGIGAAVERQFGSVGSRTPNSGAENYSPVNVTQGASCGSLGADHRETREMEAQVFLSSWRRRVAGSDESNAFL